MKKHVIALLALLVIFALNCDNSSTNPENNSYTGVIEGVDFDLLFAEPNQNEIENVLNEWENREISVSAITILDTIVAVIGGRAHQIHIIVHKNSADLAHYGAVIMPSDTLAEYPVLFYNHGGDDGVDINQFLTSLSFAPDMQAISRNHIIAIPSYRSEKLVTDTTYQSTGDPSPWDKDVDDCMNFLTTIDKNYPKADLNNVAVVGLSRGAGVAMLWAARDERIKKVVEFFGPTDLLSRWTQEITYDALNGSLKELPGLDYLNDKIIQPLKTNTLSISMARHELIKRSAVYFIDRIVPLQLHHGMNDQIVPVEQAEILIKAASDMELSEDEFQYYLHENVGHDENTFLRGLDEMATFITTE
ncbi:MAG: alpha/beta hydrolase family protein [Fidelibacterota bacterium]